MPDMPLWSRATSWLKRWGLLIGAPILWKFIDVILGCIIGWGIDQWSDELSLGRSDMNWITPGFISLLITSLIIGLIASLLMHKAQDQRDKAIKRSRGLYSEYEKLKQAYENEEQTRLRKEFNSKLDQAQEHGLTYQVAAYIQRFCCV